MEEQQNGMRRIIYIVNPVSGHRRQSRIGNAIRKETDPTRIRYDIIQTEQGGHAEELSRAAALEGADTVVAVGGDGTVNEVARGILGTGASLGIIPTGSGNGLARHLNLPMNFRKAIRIINEGKIRNIDTATLNDRLFVSLAGVGFDAYVAKKFAKSPARGFINYARIAIPSYFSFKPKKYRIVADGQQMERKALMISFANSNQFGSNASIDPVAEIDDGFIDLCIVQKIPFFRLVFIAPAFFLRQFHKTRYVEIIRAREILVSRKRSKKVHLDGDPWKTGREIRVKIQPLSLPVIVP